ncbi:MAG TPA: ferric reductase-like transmembrane domain-containing protein [Ktedonobacterales bacterium]|jgi:predicted ferric reductase|nr:ferric reductase-like transmembrane domain-containing protein [Ktedonobacterales bacterium]
MDIFTAVHPAALAAASTAASGLLGALSGAAQAAAATAAAAAAAAATASTANPFMWYATRAAAVSAYILLTLTVLMGLARSLARVARVRVSWLVEENHQILAVITAVFVALHLLTLLLDPLIPFSLINLVVPVGEPYNPIAVGAGVIALYGMVAVLLSSWLRRRMSYGVWRTLHYASFATFLLVTAHGIFAGSDTSEPWMILVYLVSAGLVGLGMLARIFWPAPTPPMPAYSQGQRRRGR